MATQNLSAALKPESAPQLPYQGRTIIDLTDDPAGLSLSAQEDHMSSIIPLISTQSGEIISSPNPKRCKSDRSEPASPKKSKRKIEKTAPTKSSDETMKNFTFKRPPNIAIPDLSATALPTLTPLTTRKTPRRPFPFLTLPPELRNKVYALLLTHSSPIELPRTARAAVARSIAWAECHSKRTRRAFKTIFLEILSTCRQVHIEATGILYGYNVFKFRSDYKEGPKNIPLPTKYLDLLKHVKVSVISREQEVGQDKWVAELLRGFQGARMEKFELTWYGWKRYRLIPASPLCQALLSLNVEKHFAVKVAGEARMKTAMFKELEEKCGTKVEIQRPVITIMRDGGRVEVSDEEE